MEETYKEKYFKYKTKYLELKETFGNSINGAGTMFTAEKDREEEKKRERDRLKRQKEKQDKFNALPEEEKKCVIKDFIETQCIKVLEDKYLNYKNKTCGFSGCREYSKFIDYVNNVKRKLDYKLYEIGSTPILDMAKKSEEYQKFITNLEIYGKEVLNKQKECKCITFF